MECRIEQFPATDSRTLYCRHWYPLAAPRGRVILLHGVESHGQWFEGTCRWLTQLGFHVAALERRGSGLDGCSRGDVDSYRHWMDDVEVLARRLGAEKTPAKIHLLGISWGGKLACACAARSSPWISSLILISPGLAPRVDVSWLTKIRIAWNYFFCPTRRFRLPIDKAAMFTANERWQSFIEKDPLRLKEVTARFLGENFKLDRFLRKNRALIRVPVLMLLAQTDAIIDKDRTRKYLETFGSAHKKILEYPGSVHTLEFEENPDCWRKDVLSWLDA